jgi:hypothetical protein
MGWAKVSSISGHAGSRRRRYLPLISIENVVMEGARRLSGTASAEDSLMEIVFRWHRPERAFRYLSKPNGGSTLIDSTLGVQLHGKGEPISKWGSALWGSARMLGLHPAGIERNRAGGAPQAARRVEAGAGRSRGEKAATSSKSGPRLPERRIAPGQGQSRRGARYQAIGAEGTAPSAPSKLTFLGAVFRPTKADQATREFMCAARAAGPNRTAPNRRRRSVFPAEAGVRTRRCRRGGTSQSRHEDLLA